jgi:hypothetical protein
MTAEMPTDIICGFKDDIDTSSQRITDKPTPIKKAVVVTVRSLGLGTYIAFGNESEQPFRLTGVNQSLDVDFIDDLSKLIVVSDGTGGYVQWIGG